MLAFSFAWAGLIPCPPGWDKDYWLPVLRIFTVGLMPVLACLVWLLSTQVYLRTGGPLKIGLVYDVHQVSMVDWCRTRSKLEGLFKTSKFKRKISLRLVPQSVMDDQQKAIGFRSRYRFFLLAKIEKSPLAGEKKGTATKIVLFARQDKDRFLEAAVSHVSALVHNLPPSGNLSLADIIDTEARRLCDAVLLFAGAACYLDEMYRETALIADHLFSELQALPEETEPKPRVRALAVMARLAAARFRMPDIPDPLSLQEKLQFAETALPYLEASPDVGLVVARLRFIAGDIPGAVDMMGRLTKVPLQPRAKAAFCCSSGFLACIQARWHTAYDRYAELLGIEEYSNLDWPDIIAFADWAAEFHENALYPRSLYRILGGVRRPGALKAAVQEWIDEDTSREKLGALLHTSSQRTQLRLRMQVSGARVANRRVYGLAGRRKRRK
jgi:hypothetical protein